MAFEYTPLTESQKLKDMYPKVNDIGNFLKTKVNLSDVETISGADFNNILDSITDSGNYYVTTSKNQPPGENWNGFVRLDKRGSNYYKIYYSPFNNNNMYVKTYANGKVNDWVRFKLDDGSLYEEGNTLNVKELSESTTQYATLVNPPQEDLDTGWVTYKESKNGVSSLVEFNPVNSTSTFKMIRRLPVQEQNPNLLRDSLFTYGKYFPIQDVRVKDDGNNPYWGFFKYESDISRTKFKNQNTVVLNDSKDVFPTVMTKRFKVGEEVKVGDTLTMSVFIKVNDPSLLKENNIYFELAGYETVEQNNNPPTGGRRVLYKDEVSTEWARYSFTFTVPEYTNEGSSTKNNYMSALLRLNLKESGTGNGFKAYYALPKLEKGNKATPFITHKDDKVQYDEIWSNWIENVDEQSILNNYTTDINTDNYFKYAWFKDNVGDLTLKDLIMTVPQGFHTFYCQGTIEGTPRDRSVRGTIQVDYDKGDPNSTNKFINVQLTDSEGLNYTLYYGGYNHGWKSLKQHRTSTILWEGTLDYGSEESITLNDSWTNYDMLEVVYSTQSAGHYKTMFLDLRTSTTPYLYIRDFNLSNSATGSGVDFFEGYLSFPTTTSATPTMVKRVTLSGSTNTTSVSDYNTQGIITIYRIAGINTL